MEQSRAGLAIEKHKQGYNCCQAVVCAYADLFGVKEEDAFRMTEALGLGMAGMMETCGAVSAMLILAGLKNSDAKLSAPSTKKESYALGKMLADAFREKNQSLICRELKGVPLRSCDGCILDAARIVEEVLFEGMFEPYTGEEF
ncbi:MAG: C_GCAxxG_C_C family protein [Clostridia bacterium]|nr:C_GCAxxG_C_C family protein [Clostridia bacterium]MBQ3554422.1 C_GCAxxG_C_C family protein [Clostridia bacterium]